MKTDNNYVPKKIRKIKLHGYSTIRLKVDKNNYLRCIGELDKDLETLSKELVTLQKNGAEILYATINIENILENLLTVYLFGTRKIHNERRCFFENELLQSSYLSFAAKKAIGQKIIHRLNLLKGSQKNILESNLKKIMDWRNAFAHGKLVNDVHEGCFIQYFSGFSKELKLDDEFWVSVERCFSDTEELLTEIVRKLDSHTSSKNNNLKNRRRSIKARIVGKDVHK